MKELFVSYPVALQLKEKGFDERTTANYWILAKDHTENYNKRLPVDESKVFFCENSQELSEKSRIDEEYYENTYHVLGVPTQYQVVDWLIQEHDIVICFDIYNKDGSLITNIKDGSGMLIKELFTNFDINERKKAYLTAIEEAIKLIL